jgi:hypothetical protein
MPARTRTARLSGPPSRRRGAGYRTASTAPRAWTAAARERERERERNRSGWGNAGSAGESRKSRKRRRWRRSGSGGRGVERVERGVQSVV